MLRTLMNFAPSPSSISSNTPRVVPLAVDVNARCRPPLPEDDDDDDASPMVNEPASVEGSCRAGLSYKKAMTTSKEHCIANPDTTYTSICQVYSTAWGWVAVEDSTDLKQYLHNGKGEMKNTVVFSNPVICGTATIVSRMLDVLFWKFIWAGGNFL
jgi:hypothetical protein